MEPSRWLLLGLYSVLGFTSTIKAGGEAEAGRRLRGAGQGAMLRGHHCCFGASAVGGRLGTLGTIRVALSRACRPPQPPALQGGRVLWLAKGKQRSDKRRGESSCVLPPPGLCWLSLGPALPWGTLKRGEGSFQLPLAPAGQTQGKCRLLAPDSCSPAAAAAVGLSLLQTAAITPGHCQSQQPPRSPSPLLHFIAHA